MRIEIRGTAPRLQDGFEQISLKDRDGFELWFHWRVK